MVWGKWLGIVFVLLAYGVACTGQNADPTLPPLVIESESTATTIPLIIETPSPTAVLAPTLTPTQLTFATAVLPPTQQPMIPTLTPFPTVVIPPTALPDAQVNHLEGDKLRLRIEPSTAAQVLTQIPELTPLTLIGRTEDNTWLQVSLSDGSTGWVMAQFVTVNKDLDTITNVMSAIPQAPDYSGVVSNITGRAREIYSHGQGLGNRRDVFSKVGDSLTVGTYFFFPIGWGSYQLGGYSHLQGVVNFFSGTTARDSNSFANTSLTADNGWTTADALNPDRANAGICHAGEAPLVCEYRVVKPAVALILFGTNDVSMLDAGQYRANLTRIVEISVEMGVIPVLSTVPPRLYFDGQVDGFNAIVREIAGAYGVPLWDYYGQMVNLPERGLSSDGVHPSWPPEDVAGASNFRPENLAYGYTVRNLTALQVLDALWKQVLY